MQFHNLFELGMDRQVSKGFRGMATGHKINLGGGTKRMPEGVVNCGYDEDYDANLDDIPYGDNSVSTIYALHFLEHVHNVNRVLADCQRVLVRGGLMNIVVPYGTCHMAVQDLDHKHFFNEDSWRHTFANPYYNPVDGEWKFDIVYNLIMGVKGENLALVTQLRKLG